MNTRIYAADKSFDIGCRVIKWDEPGGLDLTPYKKYSRQNGATHQELEKLLTQFTVHWSVNYRSKHTFNGLKARGLSCNFLIDDDRDQNGYASVYQPLDVQFAGWSQGKKFNTMGAGVELAYMPQAWDEDMYDANDQRKWNVPPHENKVAPIHGTKLKCHLPTEAQMNSLKALIWGYCELFPNIPPEFPKNEDGSFVTTKLKDPHGYTGLVNHYHLRRDKVDTAGLDMEDIEREVARRLTLGY